MDGGQVLHRQLAQNYRNDKVHAGGLDGVAPSQFQTIARDAVFGCEYFGQILVLSSNW